MREVFPWEEVSTLPGTVLTAKGRVCTILEVWVSQPAGNQYCKSGPGALQPGLPLPETREASWPVPTAETIRTGEEVALTQQKHFLRQRILIA